MSRRVLSSGGGIVGKNFLNVCHRVSCFFSIGEIATEDLEIRRCKVLPERKGMRGSGIIFRQVDHDPEMRWIRPEGSKEIRFCLASISHSEESNPTEIVGTPGFRVGGPTFACIKKRKSVGVTCIVHQCAGRLELSFA